MYVYMLIVIVPHIMNTMFVQVQTFGPPSEERAHGSVSMKTYYKYFVAGGGYILLAFSVFIFIVAEVYHTVLVVVQSWIYDIPINFLQGSVVVTDWWISDWFVRYNIYIPYCPVLEHIYLYCLQTFSFLFFTGQVVLCSRTLRTL